ncbi:MAG: phage virion morphogenesis protein [Marinobacterium sp.]|nr:phage virion morphogenesis protein [Marinobacterium sp.]
MATLKALETWAAPLLNKLSESERRKLAHTIALRLRKSQRERIRRQQDPTLGRYAARKEQQRPRNRPLRFMYDGTSRVAELKSYVKRGGYITGFDVEADDIRTFKESLISRYMPPLHTTQSGFRQKRGTIRRKMFKGIVANRHLKTRHSGAEVSVGFFGEVARIARVHQFGERDRVSHNGPEVDYEQRELLGFTDDDLDMIRDLLVKHLMP